MDYRQFEQTPDGLWRLGGEGAGFELDKPAAGLFTLTPFDGLTVTSLEAVPGEYPESPTTARKCRSTAKAASRSASRP